MSYEELVRICIHKALTDLVRDHIELDSGLDGIDLAKDGALLKIRGAPSIAVHWARVTPTEEK
jgi:hypothetical protein